MQQKKQSDKVKKLTPEQIRKGKILILVAGIIIGLLYLLFFVFSAQQQSNMEKKKEDLVVFKDSTLTSFDTQYKLSPYPDRILVHGKYLLIVQPYRNSTTIYNMEEKKKLFVIPKVVVDYDGEHILYSQNDLKVVFDATPLNTTCSGGYIKSPTEILCIVPKTDDNLDNKLISINPKTLEQKDVYSSSLTLSYVSVIENIVFLGAYTFPDHHYYLIVSGQKVPVNSSIDLLYMLNNSLYFLTFKSDFNNQTDSYSEIDVSREGITTKLIEKGRMVLWRG